MADLIRGFDWATTPLGPVDLWPDTLVTAVNLLLGSRHPMFLWWGPELIQFYNDGYRPSLGADKHPSAVGQPGIECWPEIWPIIGPQIEAVMSQARSSWNTNQLVPINRNGKLEEVYWTYGYSPVRDKLGTVHGTLVVCSETTEHVLSDLRLRTLLSVNQDDVPHDPAADPRDLLTSARTLVRKLADNPGDLPFASLYLISQNEIQEVIDTSSQNATDRVHSWPLRTVIESQTPLLIDDLQKQSSNLVLEPWPEPVTSAYLIPLNMPGSLLQAVLVCGLSPRLPFDDAYRTFLGVVSARIAGLLRNEIDQLSLANAAERFGWLADADPFGGWSLVI